MPIRPYTASSSLNSGTISVFISSNVKYLAAKMNYPDPRVGEFSQFKIKQSSALWVFFLFFYSSVIGIVDFFGFEVMEQPVGVAHSAAENPNGTDRA